MPVVKLLLLKREKKASGTPCKIYRPRPLPNSQGGHLSAAGSEAFVLVVCCRTCSLSVGTFASYVMQPIIALREYMCAWGAEGSHSPSAVLCFRSV